MIFGRSLYENAVRGITPTWSGTTISTMPPESSTDWQDFTFFRADSGNLDFTVSADTDIDAVSIYCAEASGSNTIVLQYESSPSTFTTLATFSTPSAKLDYSEYSSVTVLSGRRIRFVITAATTIDIRQLVVGEKLVFEQGAWATVTPSTFTQGIKVTNDIGANGSVLGRSVRRVERKGKIELSHLTDSWVRSSWEPFLRHAARYPFVYVWDYTGHSQDIALAYADKIEAAQHAANGFLSAQMPIRFLVSDELAV